jgi:hypothetical protein
MTALFISEARYVRLPLEDLTSDDAQPDTTDPFARFWGVLETMLDDISNPVAFTSVPLGVGTDPESSQQRPPAIPRPRKASKRDKTKGGCDDSDKG